MLRQLQHITRSHQSRDDFDRSKPTLVRRSNAWATCWSFKWRRCPALCSYCSAERAALAQFTRIVTGSIALTC